MMQTRLLKVGGGGGGGATVCHEILHFVRFRTSAPVKEKPSDYFKELGVKILKNLQM